MATRKPRYKLVIGHTKPYTSADMKFGAGTIMIKVSDALGQDFVTTTLASVLQPSPPRWDNACRGLLKLCDEGHLDAVLTEPPDRRIRDEVAKLFPKKD